MTSNDTQLWNTPAGYAPLGVVPNHKNPYSAARWNTRLSIACMVITTFVVMAKVFTKIRILKDVGWEEFFIILSWAVYMPYIALNWVICNDGVGTHQWDLMLINITKILRNDNILQILYCINIATIKISILLQLQNIFLRTSRGKLYLTIWALILTNAILYTIIAFITLFHCTPREKIWVPWMEKGTCINVAATCIATAAVNFISDIVLLVLPLYWIWNLHSKAKRKVGVGAIFGFGLVACVASMMRLVVSTELLRKDDYSWILLKLSLWLHIELTAGILAACLPCMPRFFQHVFGKKTVKGSYYATPGSGNDNSTLSKSPRVRGWGSEVGVRDFDVGVTEPESLDSAGR